MDENVAAYVTHRKIGQRFCRWYMKWLYFPMFDHHITVSEHTAEELTGASHGHRVRRGIWIAPMGVDCDRFTPDRRSAAFRNRLLELTGGARDATVLLYAGRLAPEKNLLLLIETATRLDPEEYVRHPGGRSESCAGLGPVERQGVLSDRREYRQVSDRVL